MGDCCKPDYGCGGGIFGGESNIWWIILIVILIICLCPGIFGGGKCDFHDPCC